MLDDDNMEQEDFLDEDSSENTVPSKPSKDDKPKGTISADLIRGHINTIILRTLSERDKYGYEIIEEIEKKSHGQYELKQPTLYSALKRLENQGYIKAYWKTDEISAGGRRKYYTLTESGKEITEKNRAEWEYSRTVIDNLISDKEYDFSKPAPNPVDFKILKQSTSRVPTVRLEETGKNSHYDEDQTIVAYSYSETNDDAINLDASQFHFDEHLEEPPVSETDIYSETEPEIEPPQPVQPEEFEETQESEEIQEQIVYLDNEEVVEQNQDLSEPEQVSAPQDPVQENYPPEQQAQATQPQAYAPQEPAQQYYPPEQQAQATQPQAYAPQESVQQYYPPEQQAQVTQPQAYAPQEPVQQYYPPEQQAQIAQPQAYAPQEPVQQYYPPEQQAQATQPQAYAPQEPVQQYYPPRQQEKTELFYTPEQKEQVEQFYATQIREQTASFFRSESIEDAYGDQYNQYNDPTPQNSVSDSEQQKKQHENYLKLMDDSYLGNGQHKKNKPEYGENVDTDKLIYINKPETERDYKNLVNDLYSQALKPQHPEPEPEPEIYEEPYEQQYEQPEPEPEPEPVSAPTPAPAPVIEQKPQESTIYDVQSEESRLAESDGLKIFTSDRQPKPNGKYAKNYNLGMTLLKSAAVTFTYLMIMFIITICCKSTLDVSLVYPFMIFAIACCIFAVCAIMALCGFGKNTVKPVTHRYIEVSVVLTVIAILIVCVSSILLNIDFSSASDVCRKMIIPCVTLLAAPLFTVVFYIFSK